MVKGNFIINTNKSKLSWAVDFVLDNQDYLAPKTQNFLKFIEQSDTVKLRFFETENERENFGATG